MRVKLIEVSPLAADGLLLRAPLFWPLVFIRYSDATLALCWSYFVPQCPMLFISDIHSHKISYVLEFCSIQPSTCDPRLHNSSHQHISLCFFILVSILPSWLSYRALVIVTYYHVDSSFLLYNVFQFYGYRFGAVLNFYFHLVAQLIYSWLQVYFQKNSFTRANYINRLSLSLVSVVLLKNILKSFL